MRVANYLMINATIVSGWMLLFWLCSVPVRNVAIVDIAWGLGFVLVAIVSALLPSSESVNQWLMPVMVAIWGCSLSGYLAWRNYGKPEDKRYRAMRDHRGKAFVYSSLWIVFGLQTVLLWILALPVQMGIFQTDPGWHLFHLVGIILWLVGFLFETIGDYQLARFLCDPDSRGKVMDRGLWKYTRHPNYFGDFLVWWGIYFVSLAGAAGNWWTVIGPLLISFLLMRISGVPMLEQNLRLSRPGYAEYARSTNSFFPWWPKQFP